MIGDRLAWDHWIATKRGSQYLKCPNVQRIIKLPIQEERFHSNTQTLLIPLEVLEDKGFKANLNMKI
jgi:hypothetical protein